MERRDRTISAIAVEAYDTQALQGYRFFAGFYFFRRKEGGVR